MTGMALASIGLAAGCARVTYDYLSHAQLGPEAIPCVWFGGRIGKSGPIVVRVEATCLRG
jgi:hypothetical protein